MIASLLTFPWPLLALIAAAALLVTIAIGLAVRRTAWSHERVTVTRGGLLVAALLMGVSASVSITTAPVLVDQLRRDRESVADRFDRRIKAETRARKRLAETTRRVGRLERPGDRELAERLLRGLRRARQSPQLRRELERVLPELVAATPTPSIDTTPDQVPDRDNGRSDGGGQPPERRDPAPTPTPTPAAPTPRPSGTPDPTPAPTPPAGPPPPPRTPLPPPRIPLPLVPGVGVCTPVLDVGDC